MQADALLAWFDSQGSLTINREQDAPLDKLGVRRSFGSTGSPELTRGCGMRGSLRSLDAPGFAWCALRVRLLGSTREARSPELAGAGCAATMSRGEYAEVLDLSP